MPRRDLNPTAELRANGKQRARSFALKIDPRAAPRLLTCTYPALHHPVRGKPQTSAHSSTSPHVLPTRSRFRNTTYIQPTSTSLSGTGHWPLRHPIPNLGDSSYQASIT